MPSFENNPTLGVQRIPRSFWAPSTRTSTFYPPETCLPRHSFAPTTRPTIRCAALVPNKATTLVKQPCEPIGSHLFDEVNRSEGQKTFAPKTFAPKTRNPCRGITLLNLFTTGNPLWGQNYLDIA